MKGNKILGEDITITVNNLIAFSIIHCIFLPPTTPLISLINAASSAVSSWFSEKNGETHKTAEKTVLVLSHQLNEKM